MAYILIYVKQLPDVKRKHPPRWWYLLPLLMLVMITYKLNTIHHTYTAKQATVLNVNVVRNGIAASWRTYCSFVGSNGIEAATTRYVQIINEQGYIVTEALRSEISTMLSGC